MPTLWSKDGDRVGQEDNGMRLIDKKDLMELLDDMFSRYGGTPSVMEGFKYGLDAVISEVSVMPTIDAEPVVRCLDCKYLQWNMRQDGSLPLGVDEYECRHWCGCCDPMDFCSYGERREE